MYYLAKVNSTIDTELFIFDSHRNDICNQFTIITKRHDEDASGASCFFKNIDRSVYLRFSDLQIHREISLEFLSTLTFEEYMYFSISLQNSINFKGRIENILVNTYSDFSSNAPHKEFFKGITDARI